MNQVLFLLSHFKGSKFPAEQRIFVYQPQKFDEKYWITQRSQVKSQPFHEFLVV